MTRPIRVAVIGLGKIAQQQHLPAIAASPSFTLVAGASPLGTAAGVPNFSDFEALLESGIGLDAVILCQPPQFRFEAAARALGAGKHVLLEKPPGSSSLEVEQLQRLAEGSGRTLFAAWHSRFAAAVEPARAWLTQRAIHEVRIEWLEDVRDWHPGQTWIWEPGGLGVFDPGINALSILTHLIDEPLRVLDGTFHVPHNCCTPIAAELQMRSLAGIPVSAVFDWRHSGLPTWSISIETDRESLRLSQGGAVLQIGNGRATAPVAGEYAAVYERFAQLVRAGASEVDLAPLRLVADAFLRCGVRRVEAFAPLR